MVAAQPLRPLTIADLADLPDDGFRYEVLQGELVVSPAPTAMHQIIVYQLGLELAEVCLRGGGRAVPSPVDVELSDNDIVQPDLVFVTSERTAIVLKSHVAGAPDLVFEVLSPATRRIDLIRKASLYTSFGVKEYWIVDPEALTIEVRAGKDRIAFGRFNDGDVLKSHAVEGVKISLTRVFANLPIA